MIGGPGRTEKTEEIRCEIDSRLDTRWSLRRECEVTGRRDGRTGYSELPIFQCRSVGVGGRCDAGPAARDGSVPRPSDQRRCPQQRNLVGLHARVWGLGI
jgi:hypothetical protein